MDELIYCQPSPQTGAFEENLQRLRALALTVRVSGSLKQVLYTAPAGAVEGGTGHHALVWSDVRARRDAALRTFLDEEKRAGRRWRLPVWMGHAEESDEPWFWVGEEDVPEDLTLDTLAIRDWSTKVETPIKGTVLQGHIAGAEDRRIFAGSSRFIAEGRVIVSLSPWNEGVLHLRKIEGRRLVERVEPASDLPFVDDSRYLALVVAIREYVRKARAHGVVLGLSGGVDSALILTLAVDAIGAEGVRAVMLPTDFTSNASLEDARTLAETLGVRYDVLPIKELFASTLKVLAPEFAGRPWDVTEENLQARIRGMLLMAHANKNGDILLCTSNKAEAAMGYGTLYGDLTGGFAPLIDLWKREVYELCLARNTWKADIPERILTRAPSAELRPGQKDSDSLPPYDLIEKTLTHYLTHRGLEGIDVEEATARDIVRRFLMNNFKRAQGIPGPLLGLTPPLSIVADWGLTRCV